SEVRSHSRCCTMGIAGRWGKAPTRCLEYWSRESAVGATGREGSARGSITTTETMAGEVWLTGGKKWQHRSGAKRDLQRTETTPCGSPSLTRAIPCDWRNGS